MADDFEPFSDVAIMARKNWPSAIVTAAELTFDLKRTKRKGGLSYKERRRVKQYLFAYLAHVCNLASVGAKGSIDVGPYALMEIAGVAYGDYSEDLRERGQAMFKEYVDKLCALAEKGLAAPQTSYSVQ